MEFNNLKITISRSDDKVELVFNELDNLSVNLSDSGVEDVKQLFDKVFDYIIADEKLIQFTLEDNDEDLFHEVSKDIIVQLNAEIKQSEENFEKIIVLNNWIHTSVNYSKPKTFYTDRLYFLFN